MDAVHPIHSFQYIGNLYIGAPISITHNWIARMGTGRVSVSPKMMGLIKQFKQHMEADIFAIKYTENNSLVVDT